MCARLIPRWLHTCVVCSLSLSLSLSPSLFRSVALALTFCPVVFSLVLWSVFPFPPLRVFCVFLCIFVVDREPHQQKKRKTWRGGKGKAAHNTKPKTTKESVRARATERKSEGERERGRERVSTRHLCVATLEVVCLSVCLFVCLCESTISQL